MTSSLPVLREIGLFSWDGPGRRGVVLAGCIFLSFLLHAASFYLFQIVYPPALSLLPPPARVSLITPTTEEGRTLLRWVEAEDPALASSTLRPIEMKTARLPEVEHVPSYRMTEPALKSPPPFTVDLRMPSSQPPGPVIIPHQRLLQKTAALPTTISFSDELQGFGKPSLAPPKFVGSSNEAPSAISFRIAVNRDGEVLYCFATNSSGDRELDEQARKYLALCRFNRKSAMDNDADLVWGTATIDWGNDVAVPQAKPAAAPEP
jgi:hypothetical protein